MAREITDELGTTWTASLEPTEDPTGTVDEEVLLHFEPHDGSDSREMRAVGPVEEAFGALPEPDLVFAAEAASDGRGFLFLVPGGRLWWVRSPADDPVATGGQITFTGQEDEFVYVGSLAGRPSTLSEEELIEILDEARGAASP